MCEGTGQVKPFVHLKMLQVTEGSLQQLLIIVIFLNFERIMTNKGNELHAVLKNDFTAHATNCAQIKLFSESLQSS